MNKVPPLHQLQVKILLYLLFHPISKFARINTRKVSTDLFTFHLKRLIKLGLIEKLKNGSYSLTIKGKEYANQIDLKTGSASKQAKLTILIVAIRQEKSATKILLQKRAKQPYFSYWGFITGKLKWGEKILDSAARILKEETGMTGYFEFKGTEHKIDIAPTKEVLEDKFFHIVLATNVIGKPKKSPKGSCFWLTVKEALAKNPLFSDSAKIIKNIEGGQIFFFEEYYKYPLSHY